MSKNKITIAKAFDWYLTEIMPVVEKYTLQPVGGEHGLYTHTAAVVFRGIDYALSYGRKPNSVILACAFHDMARINNAKDLMHGANAVPIATMAMDEIGGVANDTRRRILYAVENHFSQRPIRAPDYISAYTWDADRTRRAWYGGHRPQFFTSPRAQYVASHAAAEYLEFMRHNMSAYARGIIEVSEYY